jgi:hypothetical protein
MPLSLIVLHDPPFVLKSSVFEERKKGLVYLANSDPAGNANLAFNISVTDTDSQANLALSMNGVEIQRYSVKNRPVSSINEFFSANINLTAGANTIEFEIVDTPLTEGAQITISDVLLWVFEP